MGSQMIKKDQVVKKEFAPGRSNSDEESKDREAKIVLSHDGKYKCNFPGCHFANSRKICVKSHARKHAVEKCKFCDKSLVASSMKQHVARYHTKQRDFVCDHCGDTFITRNELGVHENRVHGKDNGILDCKFCYRTFKVKSVFEAHVAKCQILDAAKTRRCRKVYKENSEYKKISVPVDPGDPLKCPQCDFRGGKPMHVKRHYVSCHVKRDCTICNKTFTFQHYERHMKVAHTKELDFQCKVCDEKFFNQNLLDYHREETHIRELKYVCDNCGVSFYSRFKLNAHMTRRHRVRRHFPCELCDKSYQNKESYLKHKQKFHPMPVEKTSVAGTKVPTALTTVPANIQETNSGDHSLMLFKV